MSSYWYLILKNVISASKIEPEHVFIFFRDTHLTEPFYRIDGKYEMRLKEYKNSSEKIFDTITNSREKKWDETFKAAISNMYTFSNLNNKAKLVVPSISGRLTQFISQRFSNDFNRNEVNQILNFENFRALANDGENISKYRWNYNFNEAVKLSFLPPMIDVMKKTKMKYDFIRVQKRPGQNRSFHDNLSLNQYSNDLKQYIASNGYQLYDFTGHPEITLKMYGAGDHINKESKQRYTKLFIKAMEEMKF